MADPALFPVYPDLNGKVAIIIGIGQVKVPNSETWGNGAAMARILSHNGVKIVGCDLNMEAAEFTASRIQADATKLQPQLSSPHNDPNIQSQTDTTTTTASIKRDITIVQANALDESQISHVVNVALEKHGRIDILINNVGMTTTGDPATMSLDAFKSQLDLNLSTVHVSTSAVLKVMTTQRQQPNHPSDGGVIVNNASLTAIRYIGKPQIGYAAAKAAVVQYTKHCAALYAHKNVRVNCVIPGLIMTPLVENLGLSDQEGDREAFRRITEHNVPMGVMGDAHDVGHAVAFLCSSVAARHITGEALVVDGGLSVSTGTGG